VRFFVRRFSAGQISLNIAETGFPVWIWDFSPLSRSALASTSTFGCEIDRRIPASFLTKLDSPLQFHQNPVLLLL
jgi:hypothetical protein